MEPSKVRQLLHDAESEYYSVIGSNHLHDTRGDVDRRLRAQRDFATKPDNSLLNYMDCANFMQMKTGLPLLLCVYYMFFLSESGAAIDWPDGFDREKAEKALQENLDIDFETAVTHAVIGAFVHPVTEWREFNKQIIESVIAREDDRRLNEARRLYTAINDYHRNRA